ncbi:hypothetical protein [Aestuariivita sp.]|uniref:hypothetical protein n=1 Tax=Aestuariivita sp. TaxID=1872407 RepID=UPI00216F5F9B|nr:hypothetical protein [Aestuariivita sp.]MCE8005966.1 aldehyde dehydrogenase [Aestuariivita sp.]
MVVAGLNGFGRFGLGLFQAWYQDKNSPYDISFIHDPILGPNEVLSILKNDPIVRSFSDQGVFLENDDLILPNAANGSKRIRCSTGMLEAAEWLGEPEILFECSGRRENHQYLNNAVQGKTFAALVGATIENADTELIFGLNHRSYQADIHKVISFGSCTVIPGTHVVSAMKEKFGVKSCLVNILHSVPRWQLEEGRWNSLQRKECSLEAVGSRILNFEEEELKVNYTYAPYWGVSLMDFCVETTAQISRSDVVAFLKEKALCEEWRGIVGIVGEDIGGQAFQHSKESINLVIDEVDVRGSRAYFFGYFNNEGSGIRLHDLCCFLVEKNSDS